MKIERGSGAPVRIVATMKQMTNGVGIHCATASGIFAVVLVAMAMVHVI
jgi:hypothetical protein